MNYIDYWNQISTSKEDNLQHPLNYLPAEVKSLSAEGRDVLVRLLEKDPHKRLHSVRSLQRVALYKDFQIEPAILLKVSLLFSTSNNVAVMLF